MVSVIWIAIAAGIIFPNVVFVFIRKIGSARGGRTLSLGQRLVWERLTLGAWLSPTATGFVMYLAGYGAEDIIRGSLVTLAIMLNLLMIVAVLVAGIGRSRREGSPNSSAGSQSAE